MVIQRDWRLLKLVTCFNKLQPPQAVFENETSPSVQWAKVLKQPRQVQWKMVIRGQHTVHIEHFHGLQILVHVLLELFNMFRSCLLHHCKLACHHEVHEIDMHLGLVVIWRFQTPETHKGDDKVDSVQAVCHWSVLSFPWLPSPSFIDTQPIQDGIIVLDILAQSSSRICCPSTIHPFLLVFFWGPWGTGFSRSLKRQLLSLSVAAENSVVAVEVKFIDSKLSPAISSLRMLKLYSFDEVPKGCSTKFQLNPWTVA